MKLDRSANLFGFVHPNRMPASLQYVGVSWNGYKDLKRVQRNFFQDRKDAPFQLHATKDTQFVQPVTFTTPHYPSIQSLTIPLDNKCMFRHDRMLIFRPGYATLMSAL